MFSSFETTRDRLQPRMVGLNPLVHRPPFANRIKRPSKQRGWVGLAGAWLMISKRSSSIPALAGTCTPTRCAENPNYPVPGGRRQRRFSQAANISITGTESLSEPAQKGAPRNYSGRECDMLSSFHAACSLLWRFLYA